MFTLSRGCRGARSKMYAGLGFSAVVAMSATAGAEVITFEGLGNGLDIEGLATSFVNLSNGITSSGPNAGAAIFDSSDPGPNDSGPDPDLLVNSGNILILQNSGSSMTGDFYDTPNDDAGGGTLFFDFDDPVEMLSILIVDINGNNQSAVLTLTDSLGLTRTYTVPSEWTGDISQSEPGSATLDLTTLADQAGFLSTATAVEDLGFNAQDVVSMSVFFQGSGGLDDISFNIIPGPGALALLGLGGLARRRRRG